ALAAAFLVGLVPQMATSAPASATARAMPRPMPLLPPVTRATCPVRSKGLYMPCRSLRFRFASANCARLQGGRQGPASVEAPIEKAAGAPLPCRVAAGRSAGLQLVRHALLLGRQVARVVGRGLDDQGQLLDDVDPLLTQG